jgi:hypothetical protein
MTDRHDWNFDYSGAAQAAPEMPSVQTVTNMIVRGEKPTPEITRAFADNSTTQVTSQPAASVPAKLERDSKGNIIRPDWNQAPVPVKKAGDWDYDNDGNAKPRDEQGRYITKSEAALRAQWEKEGTAASNIAKVLAAEQSMLALAPSLQTQIASLPNDIQVVAADYLRLSPAGFGRDDRRFGSFLDALSEDQFSTFQKWFAGLSADEQTSVLITAGMK